MFNSKVIFSFTVILIATTFLYSYKKNVALRGASLVRGKVKTKSLYRTLFIVAMGATAAITIAGLVMTGFTDGTVLSLASMFYMGCFIYMEKSNFIITKEGIMYNQTYFKWDKFESYSWKDDVFIIKFKIRKKTLTGEIQFENVTEKEVERIIKKYS